MLFLIIRIILFIIYLLLLLTIAIFVPFIFKISNKLQSMFHRILLLLMGFNKPIIRDYRKHNHDNPIIIFQHNSIADADIVGYTFGISSGVFNITYLRGFARTIMKRIVDATDAIILDKNKKNNSQIILDFIKNNPDKVVCMAPAGGFTTFHNRFGEKFSSGAFILGKPVSPMLIRYSSDNGTWFVNETECLGPWKWLIKRLSTYGTKIEVILMPEMCAEKDEKPTEYAERVRIAMIEFDKTHPPNF